MSLLIKKNPYTLEERQVWALREKSSQCLAHAWDPSAKKADVGVDASSRPARVVQQVIATQGLSPNKIKRRLHPRASTELYK